jgi:hypothetical protein
MPVYVSGKQNKLLNRAAKEIIRLAREIFQTRLAVPFFYFWMKDEGASP